MEPVMYGAAAEAMAGHVTEMGARLRDRLVAGRQVELFDLMERFSTDLIVKVLFGEDPAGERGATISRALTESVAAMDHLPMGFSRLPEVFPPSKRTFHAARMTLDAAIRTSSPSGARRPSRTWCPCSWPLGTSVGPRCPTSSCGTSS